MAKIKISIFENEFEVNAPFAEGHTLTEIEAKVLNRVRAENIANNMRKHVKAAKDGGEGAPSMEEVVKQFAAYDKEYVFNMSTTRGSRKTMSPLERECNRLASAKLVELLRAKSLTKKAYEEKVGKDAMLAKIDEIAANEQIVKMAKANLKQAENAPELDVAL